MNQVELIAHRGESYDAPENTLAAFRLAWERGITAIELDIHLTQDQRLLVCHDADTKRTAGVSRLIKESNLPELQSLDAGAWKGSEWTGEKLPTLEEALETLPSGTRCFIEVKVGPESVPALERSIATSGIRPEQAAFISFYPETLAEVKRCLPQFKAFFLSSFKRNETTGEVTPTLEDLIAKAHEIQADGLDLYFAGVRDQVYVDQVKAAGLELYVWTVNDPAVAQHLAALGVDGITTDRAAWLRDNKGA